MKAMTKKLIVFGYGQRGSIYASYAAAYPEQFELTAIIENDSERIEKAKKLYPAVPIYTDFNNVIQAKIPADLVAVSTQDNQHKEHAIAMMGAGYDLLLEKPIANTEEECLEIYRASKKFNRKVIVCHVLRYTPFYSAIKRTIDSGALGEVVTIHASENVGYYHQAHSYVRGPWRNSEESSPMILAKCCHDMDILRYLMNEKCESINSYGSLFYFNEEHAPEGHAQYCSDCLSEDCIYKAQTLYTAKGKDWCANYFTTREHTKENIVEDLRHTGYDRCVYACDNDVVDHQVTIARFANGKTAAHTMTAFSREIYRDIKIYGTKAELYGIMEDNLVEVRPFGGEVYRVSVDTSQATLGGHCGGDFFMMQNVFKALNGERAEGITYLDVSVESHLMSFAAERSRLNDGKPELIQNGEDL